MTGHIEHNPENGGLKELLAVKKSLGQIQLNIQSVISSVRIFSRELEDVQFEYNLENTLKYFHHNVTDVETEIKMMIDNIEDTDQFVSIHLDTVR